MHQEATLLKVKNEMDYSTHLKCQEELELSNYGPLCDILEKVVLMKWFLPCTKEQNNSLLKSAKYLDFMSKTMLFLIKSWLGAIQMKSQMEY